MDPRTIRHESVDSTNEQALAEVAAGRARHLDAHLARTQTAGRGTRGRTWIDEPDASVLASVVVLPPGAVPHPEALTMAAGLALLETARDLGLGRAHLDWPNDLAVDGAKLAGVLVESRGVDPNTPHFVVGVGLNVAQRLFPEDLTRERAVTSLSLEGVTTATSEVARVLISKLRDELDRALADAHTTARRYLDATDLRGERVAITTGTERLEGELIALDLDRGLAVEQGAKIRWTSLAHVAAVELCEG